MEIISRHMILLIFSLVVVVVLGWFIINMLSVNKENEDKIVSEKSTPPVSSTTLDKGGEDIVAIYPAQSEEPSQLQLKANTYTMSDLEPLAGSRMKTICSPDEPPLPWKGLVINAVGEVKLESKDGFAGLIICGYYRVDLVKLLDGKALNLVAVNVSTGQEYRGEMLDPEEGTIAKNPDAEPVTPDMVEGMSTASYFNPDLLAYVDLPKTSAIYDIFAEYGGHTSNVVRVKVVID